MAVSVLIGRLLELLYPPRCAFCRGLLAPGSPGSGICPDCGAILPRTAAGQSAVQPVGSRSRCLSPLLYEGVVAHSIRRYKFSGRACYHTAYGPLLRFCLTEHLDLPPDLITWAPLSRLRQYRRGYDQAQLLAQEAASLYGQRPVRLLRKVRNTRPQSSLSPEERKLNAQDVYQLAPNAPEIAGKRILLVDDVITTGSTLSACADVLLDAGAAEVICLTLARSGAGQPI